MIILMPKNGKDFRVHLLWQLLIKWGSPIPNFEVEKTKTSWRIKTYKETIVKIRFSEYMNKNKQKELNQYNNLINKTADYLIQYWKIYLTWRMKRLENGQIKNEFKHYFLRHPAIISIYKKNRDI